MNITVLFNNSSIRDDLAVGWGLSLLIGRTVLFDTGEKGELLADNIGKLSVDLTGLESAVISHDHWDHTGGLPEILRQKPRLRVHGCPGFSEKFKAKVKDGAGRMVEHEDFTGIARGVFVTGEIQGAHKGTPIAEQALVIGTGNGLTVITGCAHPGILQILNVVKSRLPGERIYCVLGGFHLMNETRPSVELIIDGFKKMGVVKAGPTHCSGTEAENIFRDAYKDDFFSVKAGETFTV